MGIALLGSMMLFGCRKIGETAPETASAGTSYVSEETAGESKTETKATEPPAPTEDPAPEPLVPEAIEPTPAEDALPEGMVKSYLTGEPVAEVQGRRRPVAVMLSNIISACPQSGISRAGVIYEAPVEGGITRLMGLFENYDDLEKIGSVRSCREYYVYLAAGFDALYYHYGQAAYAIPLLESHRQCEWHGVFGTGVLPDVGSSVAAQCVFGCGRDCSGNRSLRLPDILQRRL